MKRFFLRTFFFSVYILGAIGFLVCAGCAPALRGPVEDVGQLAAPFDYGPAHYAIKDLPLVVFVSPDFSAEDTRTLDALTKRLNREIGTEVFMRAMVAPENIVTRVEVAAYAPPRGVVYVYQAQYWNGRENQADTINYYDEVTRDGTIVASVIRMPDGPGVVGFSHAFGRELLLHELGHALGLGHDSLPSSVMFPRVSDYSRVGHADDDPTDPFELESEPAINAGTLSALGASGKRQKMTRKDLLLLRRLYSVL